MVLPCAATICRGADIHDHDDTAIKVNFRLEFHNIPACLCISFILHHIGL